MSDVSLAAPRFADQNNRREIFGWTMYDWANSAFSTTVVAALLGPYLTALAQGAVGENGVIFQVGGIYSITAKSFFSDCVSLSVLLQVFFLPILGAIADYTNLKKRLMRVFCYTGVVATCLMFALNRDLYLLGGLLFIVANLAFGAAIVFYNAYLPEIATEDQRDKVSSRGFALGYLGGGLLLALNLALVIAAQSGALSADTKEAKDAATDFAVRLSLLSAGVWWGTFALLTFRRLKTREPANRLEPGASLLGVGFREVGKTFRELRRLPSTLRYLIGYLFFNDGIQTVISLSSVFLVQELFVAKGRSSNEAQSFLLSLVLMIQFVAFAGALLFARIARITGTKRAIMLSLVIWSVVVIYAYGLLETVPQAYVMAAIIALVLGGSQALSRSLFSQMIPHGREASFFGIYEVSERGTSWLGPFIFARVVASTGSYRQAILSLIVLFVVGTTILAFTNTTRAISESGNVPPEVGDVQPAAA